MERCNHEGLPHKEERNICCQQLKMDLSRCPRMQSVVENRRVPP